MLIIKKIIFQTDTQPLPFPNVSLHGKSNAFSRTDKMFSAESAKRSSCRRKKLKAGHASTASARLEKLQSFKPAI